MQNYFYYSLTKKYLISLVNLFKTAQISYINSTGVVEYKNPSIVLPFQSKETSLYGSFYFTKDVDNNPLKVRYDTWSDKKIEFSKITPCISLNNISMSYDNQRQLNQWKKFKLDGEGKTIPTPVPYTISSTVNIVTTRIDENMQIIEQLLPKFSPNYVMRINIPELHITDLMINVTLDSVDAGLMYQLEASTERLMVSALNVKISTFFFSIKDIDEKLYVDYETELNDYGMNHLDTNLSLTEEDHF